jgi:hypothetical protein
LTTQRNYRRNASGSQLQTESLLKFRADPMTKPRRPFIVTLLAGLNFLFSLGSFASVAVTIASNPEHFQKPAEVAQTSPAPGAAMPAARPSQPEPVHPLPDPDMAGIRKEQSKWLIRQIPTYELFVILSIIASLVLAVLYLGSAVGMLTQSSAGRRLAIAAALIAPLVAAGACYYYWTQIRPELQKWETNRNNQIEKVFLEERPEDKFEKQATTAVVLRTSVMAGYSLLLLVCMFLPRVRASFMPCHEKPQPATDQPQN